MQIDKVTHWGDLESEEEEEESEEEEEMEEDGADVDSASIADGISSMVSYNSTIPSGLDTPATQLDLRKGKAGGALLIKLLRFSSLCNR